MVVFGLSDARKTSVALPRLPGRRPGTRKAGDPGPRGPENGRPEPESARAREIRRGPRRKGPERGKPRGGRENRRALRNPRRQSPGGIPSGVRGVPSPPPRATPRGVRKEARPPLFRVANAGNFLNMKKHIHKCCMIFETPHKSPGISVISTYGMVGMNFRRRWGAGSGVPALPGTGFPFRGPPGFSLCPFGKTLVLNNPRKNSGEKLFSRCSKPD
jgi:hypothetical protein